MSATIENGSHTESLFGLAYFDEPANTSVFESGVDLAPATAVADVGRQASGGARKAASGGLS